jgi:hypothetical protein
MLHKPLQSNLAMALLSKKYFLRGGKTMCYGCGSKISVLYSMTVQQLLDYANENRGSPAAANGRLKEAIEVLQKNGGCSSCIGYLERTMQSIF